jgi:Ice-binding-like
MSQQSVGGVPTSGVGYAVAVALSGTGIVKDSGANYHVSIPVGGSVIVSASAVDISGAAVGGGGGGALDSHLGVSSFFAILAASAVTGSTGAGSVVSGGNIGIAPNGASSVTNFPPSVLVAPGVFHYADPLATQAQIDLAAAIVYFQGLTPTQTGLSNLSSNDGGGGAGVYHAGNFFSAAASSLDIPTSITLDAQGNPNATFVFVAGSTITLESGASVLLVNGAQAANVYWVNGSSFTSVDGGTSNMVGTILAHTSITLGGGTLVGRALANIGAVTLSTTETITSTGAAGAAGANAITLASAPQAVLPAWYKPSNLGANYPNVYMAPAVVTDDDSNPWTVLGRSAGQTVISFQCPTFGNTEGAVSTDQNVVMDETPRDTIFAHLVVTCTGSTS